MTIIGAGYDAAGKTADDRNKGVTFKNCASCIKCISKINDTEKCSRY